MKEKNTRDVSAVASAYFIGEIIVESLTTPAVLDSIKRFLVLSRTAKVNDFDPPQWNICRYRMSEAEVLGLVKKLEYNFNKNEWYIHFYSENSNKMYVILPGKTFVLPKFRDESWDAMIAYGESVGVGRRWIGNIPVDFHKVAE